METLEELLREPKEISVITDSDLTKYGACPYSYFLSKHRGLTKIPRSAFAAQSLFFDNAKKALFNLRDPLLGRITEYQHRAGPDLKMAEEMNEDELRKYLANSSAEAFGNSLFNEWMRHAYDQEYAGSPLMWGFPEQPQTSAQQLKKAGIRYYNFILKNGAPIFGFINKDVTFKFQDYRLRVKLPEVRNGMIIDDTNLWSFDGDANLVTMRKLAFQNSAAEFPYYRMKWRIPDEIADSFSEDYLDDRIQYRHLNLDKNQLDILEVANLDGFKRSLHRYSEGVKLEKYEPNLKSCASCAYNILDLNGRPVCELRKKGEKTFVPYSYLDKNSFRIDKKVEDGKISLTGIIEKEGRLVRKVSQYTLLLNENKGFIEVKSNYGCYARGIGFEEKNLIYMDSILKKLAEKSNKKVIHTIDFEKDFDFAGKQNIRKKLYHLGYHRFSKTYYPSSTEVPHQLKMYTLWDGKEYYLSLTPGAYAVNLNAKIFGRVDCKSGQFIDPENRAFVPNMKTAIKARCRPCLKCNPANDNDFESWKQDVDLKPYLEDYKSLTEFSNRDKK